MIRFNLPRRAASALGLALAMAMTATAVAQSRAPAPAPAPRGGDHIVAVVNQELVTNREVEQRMARIKEGAQRSNSRLPGDRELRQQVLDTLIEERVILTSARELGVRVEDAELDRAVQAVAAQNQLTLPQLQQRLREEGMDYARFRSTLRDQMIIERLRDREIQQRIRITDQEIDEAVARQAAASTGTSYNIAQILVRVPEGATVQETVEREARARSALQRVRSGEDFAAVARQVSEDPGRERGGELGLRPADRLPEAFVQRVRMLSPGQVSPELLRSGAGFHVLKLVDRQETSGVKVVQTRARHILLRPSATQNAEAARRRLAEVKRDIERGSRRFEDVARELSQDGSAPQGGDLGWVSPGAFVPEFEEVMNRLPVGAVSDPVVSRFGVHLIQVVERREAEADPKQLREQARAALREQKLEEAYAEWVGELRSRAYVELREPPL